MSEGGGGDETTSVPASPNNRVKFMCSYGGKILPRPLDGNLKYVGGETRVVAVSRDINFSDLMQKLSSLCDGDIVLKYQLIPEDLDALITVRSDEDVYHMLDEYNRQEAKGAPKLRAFLFPAKPVIVDSQATSMEPQAFVQRYVDAINGIAQRTNLRRMRIDTSRPGSTLSSACSSPKSLSPNSPVADSMRPPQMHRVQSSPTLCTLNSSSNNSHPQLQRHLNSQHVHHHHYYQNPQYYQCRGLPPSRPFDHLKGGGERPVSASPMGWTDTGRSQMDQGWGHYYSPMRHRRSGGGNNFAHPESSGYGNGTFERAGSVPQSPTRVIWE